MNTPVLFVCLFPHSSASQNTEQSQFQFSSVHFSRSVVSDSLRPHESQHARPPCPSPTPGVYSNKCPSSQWRHPTISSSVIPFSSRPQSLPASGSFPMSQLFAWGSQSIGVSASASGSHKSKFACARLLTGGSGEETTCKLIQVVGQIQILVVIGLGLRFLFFSDFCQGPLPAPKSWSHSLQVPSSIRKPVMTYWILFLLHAPLTSSSATIWRKFYAFKGPCV